MPPDDFFSSPEEVLEKYLAVEQMKVCIQAELSGKLSTVLARMDSMQETFERTFGPAVTSVQEVEEIKRKVNLTPGKLKECMASMPLLWLTKEQKAQGRDISKMAGKFFILKGKYKNILMAVRF